MIIKQLYISEFGCFKNKHIEFSDGKKLNIIYGENESGKSTVFLFIKFMFYGLQRKSQSNKERDRSINWSSGIAAGSIEFEYKGQNYRIERKFSENTRGGETVKAICLDNGMEVDTDRSFGEYFFGVPREVFESSSCVGQLKSGEIYGEKTAQSLANMLSSGDESVDTSSALKDLDAIRTTFRHKKNTGGSLIDDESKINALRLKLDDAKNANFILARKSETFEKVKKEYDELKIELERKDALVMQFNKIGVLRRFEALRQKMATTDSVVAKKDDFAKGELKTEFFPTRDHVAELKSASRELSEREALLFAKEREKNVHTPEFDRSLAELGELAEKSGGKEQILRHSTELRASAEKKAKIALGTLIAALSVIAFAVLGFLLIHLIAGIIISVAAVGVIAISISFFVLSSNEKKKSVSELLAVAEMYGTQTDSIGDRIDECMNELLLMRRYTAEHTRLIADLDLAEVSFETSRERAYKLLLLTLNDENIEPTNKELDREADRLAKFLDEYERLQREEDAFMRMLENERVSLSRYDEQKLREEITVNIDEATPEAVGEAERTRSFLMAKKTSYESKITMLQDDIAVLRIKAEDPILIADKLAQLEEKYKKDKEFYDALMLAISTIEDSTASMRGSVMPAISQIASELMTKISDGRYEILRAGTTLGVTLDKDGFGIPSELLSAGTRDVAYLSLRLALIKKIYDEDIPPIIFDESFCQLDSNRLKRMLEVISSFAEQGIQVFIFTSHKRESEICQTAEIESFLLNL